MFGTYNIAQFVEKFRAVSGADVLKKYPVATGAPLIHNPKHNNIFANDYVVRTNKTIEIRYAKLH